jgi:hypothetical protein
VNNGSFSSAGNELAACSGMERRPGRKDQHDSRLLAKDARFIAPLLAPDAAKIPLSETIETKNRLSRNPTETRAS